MRLSRLSRLLRGSLAGTLATFVALFFHVASGGAAPAPLGVAAPLLLSIFLSVLIAGRRVSLLRLSASVTASQLLFHTLFVLGTPTVSGSVIGGHHATTVLIPIGAGPQYPDVDLAMLCGHALAGIVTILALYYAERAVLGFATFTGWFRLWWSVVTAPTPTETARPSTPIGSQNAARPRLTIDLDSASRRGPPASPAY